MTMFYPVDYEGSGNGFPRGHGPGSGQGQDTSSADIATYCSYGNGKGDVAGLFENGTGIGYTRGWGWVNPAPASCRRRRE